MIPKQQPKMIARKAIVLIVAFACLLIASSKAVNSGEHALLLRASLVEPSSPKQKERSLNEGTETTEKQREKTVKPETLTEKPKKGKKTAKALTTAADTETLEKKESTGQEEANAEEKGAAANYDAPDSDKEKEEPDDGKAIVQPTEEKDDVKDEEGNKDETQQEGDEDKKAENDGTPEKDTPQDDDTDKVDPCQEATSCTECVNAASNKTAEEKACVWKDKSCQLVSKDDAPSEFLCANETEAAAKTTPDELDRDDEGSVLPAIMTFFVIGGILIAIRAYAETTGASIPGVGNVRASLGSSHRGSSRNTEIVPLAGADDDDWGWDDSGGDVELSSRAKQQEEEDLRMAMALSLSESPAVPKPKQTSSATRRTNSGSRSTPINGGNRSSSGDWDDWDEESPSAAPVRPTIVAPKPAVPKAPPNKIANLGTRQTSAPRREAKAEKPKPKQEDDIFASMGLAAKPTFSSTGGGRTVQASVPATSGLSAAAEDVDVEIGSNWGDDSDLDDLLDD